MTVIAVDANAEELTLLANTIQDVQPETAVYIFLSGEAALRHMDGRRCCDAAFIRQDSGGRGRELARILKERYPQMHLIFVSGTSGPKGQAQDMYVSGSLLLSVTREAVREELERLRCSVSKTPAPAAERESGITAQCFGSFEVYADRRILCFHYSKAKEFLAYLIDARSMCSNEEIMAALWEIEISGSYFRSIRKDVIDTLRGAGCEEILIRQRGRIGVDMEKVHCDYYDWLKEPGSGAGAYCGEYMRQYEWAQYTNARLQERVSRQ